MENLQVYVFVSIGAAIVLIVVLSVAASRKRRAALEAIARQAFDSRLG